MKRTDPFYSSTAWKKCRRIILQRDHFLCQECLKRKIITQADTVHHIIEYQIDKSKALDADNLISVCASCHNKIHSDRASKQYKPKRKHRVRVLTVK